MAAALAPIISTPYLSSVPAPGQGHGGVEGRLAAQRRQQRQLALRAGAPHLLDFARDDFFHRLRGNRFDVGAVGKFRVGHDGGRIGIDQDNAEALLAQGLAGLRARVIEFARLADDNRPAPMIRTE